MSHRGSLAWTTVLAMLASLRLAQAAPAPSTQPVLPALPPVSLTRAQVAALDATLLGDAYDSANDQKLWDAHCLIERYFACDSSAERKLAVKAISAIGLPPWMLGRLTHVRLTWPQLRPGVYYIDAQQGPTPVHYFLGVPARYTPAKAWPLVIMLPTPQAFLTQPPPDPQDVTDIYTQWIQQELTLHADALVLMPLLNLTDLYGPGYAGMNDVIQPMIHAASEANINPARVYLVGHAMAAHAVWNIALHYATYFAAINPMAGGASADWQRLRMRNLLNVLPVVWHDSDDMDIPVKESRDIVDVLHRLKVDVEYDETHGLGHAPRPDVIEDCYQKMRARVRELYPAEVAIQSDRPDSEFNRIDWIQVYQEISPGSDVVVRYGQKSFFHLYQNSFSLDALFDQANHFDISTRNVETMRLYFNDQMVDFSKPVTITVNHRVRFSGMLHQDIDQMLRDELFLGRGWRYFTAILDMDLATDLDDDAPRTSHATAARPAPRSHGTAEMIGPDGKIYRFGGGSSDGGSSSGSDNNTGN